MMKSSNIKLAVALLVFIALYVSYLVPVVTGQKIIQLTSLAFAFAGMLFIMRDPNENKKRILNAIVTFLIVVSFFAFMFVKGNA